MKKPVLSALRSIQSCIILLTLLMVSSPRAEAADINIDLFTAGPDTLTLTMVGSTNNTMTGLANVIGSARRIDLEMTAEGPGAPEVKAVVLTGPQLLNYTSGIDDDGRVALTYNANGAGLNADLTAGMLVAIRIRLFVDAAAVAGGMPLAVTLTDGSANTFTVTQMLTMSGFQFVQFTLSSFTGVNLTDVDSIVIDADPMASGDLAFSLFSVVEDLATPTPTATRTGTATRTATATSTRTSTGTATNTATATVTPTATATGTATGTATNTGTATATRTGTATATASGTGTATATQTQTATATHTGTATATQTGTGTATATATGTATVTSTGTATQTPTQTCTPTRAPIGADCADPGQCISGFCVDGVCCGSICNGPGEYCDTPNQPGICVDRSAPAPAMGAGALGLAGLLLGGIAALALRRRR